MDSATGFVVVTPKSAFDNLIFDLLFAEELTEEKKSVLEYCRVNDDLYAKVRNEFPF
jgi:hypothetical protein